MAHRIRLLAAAAAIFGVAVFAASVQQAQSRAQGSYCVAHAVTPYIDTLWWTAQPEGETTSCPSGSEHWSGTLDLQNGAGSSLGFYPINISDTGNKGIIGNPTGCRGATVRTFMYIDDAGHGSSDTSGYDSTCAY